MKTSDIKKKEYLRILKVFLLQRTFNKEINFDKNYNFKENSLISNTDWKDVYYQKIIILRILIILIKIK